MHIVVAQLERVLGNDDTAAAPAMVLVDEASQTSYRLRAERTLGADGRPRGLVILEPNTSPGETEELESLARFGLSRRESEVAAALVRGRTNAEIAAALVVSPHTVRDHVRSVFDKLDVSSRHQLALRLLAGS